MLLYFGMDKRVYIALAVLAAVGAWAAFAMNGVDKLGQKATGTTPVPTTTPTKAMETQMVAVEGLEFKFTPDTITLKEGQKTVITYKNVGNFPHDLVIADLGVRTQVISGGKEETIEFIPTKSGTFGFICSVGDHERRGMKGEVVVE